MCQVFFSRKCHMKWRLIFFLKFFSVTYGYGVTFGFMSEKINVWFAGKSVDN